MCSLFFSMITGFALLLAAFPLHMNAAENQISWHCDYEAAVRESKVSGKPILLFFTGSGWCGYCVKLERDVFSTSQFAKVAGNQYIFVKLDFTARGEPKNSQFKQQHTNLVNRHAVQGYPKVVILNSQEQVLLTTGYRAGGPEQYAAHLQTAYAQSASR